MQIIFPQLFPPLDLVDPGEYQANGPFSEDEIKYFMSRLEDWSRKGYQIGSSWGMFSRGIPNRVNYNIFE